MDFNKGSEAFGRAPVGWTGVAWQWKDFFCCGGACVGPVWRGRKDFFLSWWGLRRTGVAWHGKDFSVVVETTNESAWRRLRLDA